MFSQWGHKCAFRWLTWHRFVWCSRGPLQAGHRRAWSEGGKTTPSNLMPLCRRHNRDQGTQGLAMHALAKTLPIIGPLVIWMRVVKAAARRIAR